MQTRLGGGIVDVVRVACRRDTQKENRVDSKVGIVFCRRGELVEGLGEDVP